MKDRNGLVSVASRDAAALMRRLLAVLLCVSSVVSFTPQALAEGSRSNREKSAGAEDGGSKGRNRDSGSGGEESGTGKRGGTQTGRDRGRNSGGGSNTGDSDRISGRPARQQDNDREKALEAAAGNHLLPLKDALDLIDQDRYGIVISIDLKRYDGNDIYRMKTRDRAGVIRDLRIDARTGKFLNVLGF